MVLGLSPKLRADGDVEKVVEEGVAFTANGPLVQAEECALCALINVACAESKPAKRS
jgi:hypothetical protein